MEIKKFGTLEFFQIMTTIICNYVNQIAISQFLICVFIQYPVFGLHVSIFLESKLSIIEFCKNSNEPLKYSHVHWNKISMTRKFFCACAIYSKHFKNNKSYSTWILTYKNWCPHKMHFEMRI